MSEYRPGGFQILPPAVKTILIINIVFFLALNFTGAQGEYFLLKNFALFNWKTPLFKPWQLVTHMFMHEGVMHIFFNMFALWMFGNVIETVLGTKRFIIFYLVCGIGAALCFSAVQILMGGNLMVPMLGASGAIFGLLFAFGYMFPDSTIYMVVIPMKAKHAVALYAGAELFFGFINNPTDNVAHFAHLGGMLFAYLLLLIWKKTKQNNQYR